MQRGALPPHQQRAPGAALRSEIRVQGLGNLGEGFSGSAHHPGPGPPAARRPSSAPAAGPRGRAAVPPRQALMSATAWQHHPGAGSADIRAPSPPARSAGTEGPPSCAAVPPICGQTSFVLAAHPGSGPPAEWCPLHKRKAPGPDLFSYGTCTLSL